MVGCDCKEEVLARQAKVRVLSALVGYPPGQDPEEMLKTIQKAGETLCAESQTLRDISINRCGQQPHLHTTHRSRSFT
jgi:hypothetical protein